MYEYIKGILTFVGPAYVVLESSGIGYQLYIANPFRFSSQLNNEIKLYIHQAVREDAITLYGFKDYSEKLLYLKLLSVSGIGPKSGLAILANDDHTGLVQAVENDDAGYLTKFPGVGKKTAAQIVLDLKGKLADLGLPAKPQNEKVPGHESSGDQHHLYISEALEALAALGYSSREIKLVKTKLQKIEKGTTDAYLREALKLLMKK